MKRFTWLMAQMAVAFSCFAQFTSGAFLLTEGQYGSSSGGLFWLSPETMTFGEISASQQVNGVGYGETSQYATIYGDKVYVTSKQSGAYGGGVLTIADAQSVQNQKIFSELASDGHNYDGRAFCGVSETKGYLGTSNGIFVINLVTQEVVKFIEGTQCGYGAGETINGGWYQYDVYWNQIGSMIRVGNRVFASQQNRGLLVIDAESDEIETIISAESFAGSFGDLILSKDGNLWTTTCQTENYSYDQNPETNTLVKIDPYELTIESIELEHKVSVSWATWRTPMMQALKNRNVILWRDVYYTFEQVGAPQICYYDIDKQEEGVLVDLSEIDPNYSIYSGICVDPETDNVYVPVASNSGYGPWYLLIFNSLGEQIEAPINIPIGDWSDYPAMMVFTDDYAPQFMIEDECTINIGETVEFKLVDIVSDKDNIDAAIIVDVESVNDDNILTAEISNGSLKLSKNQLGLTSFKLIANSNGKIMTKEIVVKDPIIDAEKIILDNTEVELKVDESIQLGVTVLPDDASNKIVAWSSSDERVATVEDGVVTAKSIGEAVITVSTTDGTSLMATCVVTVVPTLATSITLDITEREATEGDEFTLTATVLPVNATNASVVWSSSDDRVATVEDGLVKVLKAGVATITVSTTDGSNLSATCVISAFSGIITFNNDECKISVINNNVYISGISNNMTVAIYTIDGVQIFADVAIDETMSVTMPQGVYIVKVGGLTKVVSI